MWTRFMDMHSGGDLKEKWNYIFIEAPIDEAKVIFYNRFGHNPERVSCTCCGEDYSMDEHETLEEATAYDRHCEYVYFDSKGRESSEDKGFVAGKGMRRGYSARYVERQNPRYIGIRSRCNTSPDDPWGLYVTLSDAIKRGFFDEKDEKFLVIREDEIKPEERVGELPAQGYVWVD